MKSNISFYNSASDYYDKMIDFDSALQKRKELLSGFITPQMKSVADVGCGTGVDSISLSLLGLNVFAFDPSLEMINAAKANSERKETNIEFYNYPANKIPKIFYNKFDLVVSLGNTLANIPFSKIKKSVSRLFKLVKKDGSVLIQILNYEKILMEKERIVNITKKDGEYFIRFYDFGKKDLTFNILRFNADDTSKKELISTKIFPYISKEIKKIFKASGFKEIEIYGSLNKQPFVSKTSNDLVLSAKK
jgi:ubiquinone/menaquinone biosynthesis C-methylase UbiE